jgi:CheY-like chemotaxis protein
LSILTSERVDILLTDVGLPDMSGTMLAEYAVTRAPQLAVVLVTGQAPDHAERGGMRVPILMKPFSLDALLGVIGLVEGAEH